MAYNTLATTIQAGVSSTITKTSELSTVTDVMSIVENVSFSLGAGANQANQVFQDQRTLADAANETLNFLAAGSLVDKLGDTIDLDELRALFIHNNSADADLVIGGAAANQLPIFAAGTDKLNLPPGGVFIFIAPDANGVDVSTNSQLKLEHDGTGSSDLVYDIVVVGSS
jgi:hypothetical protein